MRHHPPLRQGVQPLEVVNVLVVEEHPPELVARLTEENFSALKAAPLRIAALDLPVPFAPELEHAFRPTKESIVDAISAWMG